jgi:microcystin degradation protein MlrC
MKPAYYREVGLHPSRADIVMVKSLFPFRMYFALHNRKTVYAKTRGPTDFDAVTRQTFDGPVHPQVAVHGWREADSARRGVGGSPSR